MGGAGCAGSVGSRAGWARSSRVRGRKVRVKGRCWVGGGVRGRLDHQASRLHNHPASCYYQLVVRVQECKEGQAGGMVGSARSPYPSPHTTTPPHYHTATSLRVARPEQVTITYITAIACPNLATAIRFTLGELGFEEVADYKLDPNCQVRGQYKGSTPQNPAVHVHPSVPQYVR